jgi:hypothetical protein
MAKKLKGERVVIEPVTDGEKWANWEMWKLMSGEFDVPQGRIGDKQWLLRNLGIRNNQNLKFDLAIRIIRNMPEMNEVLGRG